MIPKSPDVYFDIARENRANSDVIASGGGSITSYTSNNRSGSLYNWTLKDPELYYNPWEKCNDCCECTQLKQGIWHITKLSPNSTQDFERIIFQCPISQFKGFGNKFNIFISNPGDKIFDESNFFIANSDGTETSFWCDLDEGSNLIDISKSLSTNANYAYLRIPKSFYNKDENGGLLETETNFYIVFFPVFDQLNASGFGIYNSKTFNEWQKLEYDATEIINDREANVKTIEGEAYAWWAFRDLQVCYYIDNNIIVFSPYFNAFKKLNPRESSLVYLSSIRTHGTSPETSGEISKWFNVAFDGSNIEFYGDVLIGDFSDTMNAYYSVNLYTEGTWQMLPYNFDKLAVRWEENEYKNYIQVQENGENIGEIWNTIIADFTNKKSQGDSYISRVVWTQSENDGYDGYKGLRITANDENTLPAYQNTFNGTNDGITYINGRRNQTLLDKDLLYTRNTGAVVNNRQLIFSDNNASTVKLFADRIQVNTGINSVSSFDGDFYKFLAFKEPLTTWQINYLMKIYNFYK